MLYLTHDYKRSHDEESMPVFYLGGAKMVTVYACALPGWNCDDEGVCLCLTWVEL